MQEDNINLEIDTKELDLESLIVDGANARIPIEVEFPIYHEDGTLTYETRGAVIKPLKSHELTNASQIGLRLDDSDVNTEIVKAGLCRKDGSAYPPGVIESFPAGVISALANKILDVSGVKPDKKAAEEYMKMIAGF